MTDPSISPNSIKHLRIICIFEDSYHTEEDGGGQIHDAEDHLLLKRVDDPNWRETASVFCVEFWAPAGYEWLVGQGILWYECGYNNSADCGWAVQEKQNGKWVRSERNPALKTDAQGNYVPA